MIHGETINLRAVERHDVPLLHRWFNDPVVMDGWGWGAPARSIQHVAGQVEDWLAREIALGHPEDSLPNRSRETPSDSSSSASTGRKPARSSFRSWSMPIIGGRDSGST